MSELSKLIYERQKEWVSLNDSLGTDFPIVEDNKRRCMAYLEMLIEDLRNLRDDQPTLNPNQKIVLGWLKGKFVLTGKSRVIGVVYALHQVSRVTDFDYVDAWKAYRELNTEEEAQVLQIFGKWVEEQEAEQ